MAGYLHRTATTAYPCYLPILGEFSRSWPYKTCRGKDKGKKLLANGLWLLAASYELRVPNLFPIRLGRRFEMGSNFLEWDEQLDFAHGI